MNVVMLKLVDTYMFVLRIAFTEILKLLLLPKGTLSQGFTTLNYWGLLIYR